MKMLAVAFLLKSVALNAINGFELFYLVSETCAGDLIVPRSRMLRCDHWNFSCAECFVWEREEEREEERMKDREREGKREGERERESEREREGE